MDMQGDGAARPLLVVFAGLPGSGKTTLAREVAQYLGAVHIRIDTIEQTIRDTCLAQEDIGPAGYQLGYAIARDNLGLGLTVVADSVNPIAITRDAWRQVAEHERADCVEVEVVCSDPVEHRQRVEGRVSDIPGLELPSWQQVAERHVDPWDRPVCRIDTAGRAIEDNVREVLGLLAKR